MATLSRVPGTHAAVLPRLCRAVIALLAGLAIVVLAPVFACADAGTAHHEGGESLRGSALAVALAPASEAHAEAAREHAAGHVGDHLDGLDHLDHLDDHGSHADCREPCCEPSAALPDAVVRDDSTGDPRGFAAHPVPTPAAPAPWAAGTRAAPPAAGPRPAGRPGPALLRLVCVSRT